MAGSDTLIWHPLGGNPRDDVWTANGHVYQVGDDAIMIDLGDLIIGQAEGGPIARMPDAGRFLEKPGDPDHVPEVAVKAFFLSHPHEDHFGAIEHHIRLGYRFPTVHGSPNTIAGLRAKLAQSGLDQSLWPETRVVDAGQTLDVGGVSVEPVWVTHSVPQAMGFIVKGAGRTVFHSGDIKADQTPVLGPPTDLARLTRLGDEGVDMMVVDCGSATRPGLAPQEADIRKGVADLVEQNPDRRLVIGAFGGYQELVASVAQAAAANDRALVVDGQHIKTFIKAMEHAGIDLKAAVEAQTGKPLVMLEAGRGEALTIDPAKTVMLVGGIQGQEDGTLMRAAKGDYPGFTIGHDDVVVITALPVPGFETSQQTLKRTLAETGAELVGFGDHPITAFGHGFHDDIKQVLNAVRPQVTVPTHSTHTKLNAAARLIEGAGFAAKVVCNGNVAEVTASGVSIVATGTERIVVAHNLKNDPPDYTRSHPKTGVEPAAAALTQPRMRRAP